MSPVYEGAFTLRAVQERTQAHRTLRRFLDSLYWDRTVRPAAGQPGAWLNSYPPRTPTGAYNYVPITDMDPDRPVAVHLARGRRGAPGSGPWCSITTPSSTRPRRWPPMLR